MNMDRYIDTLKNRLEALDNLISAIEQRLPSMHEGKLRIQHYHNSFSYYFIEKDRNDNGTLIGSEDINLVRELAQRSYYQKVLRSAKEERKLISQFLKRCPQPSVEEVFDKLPPNRKLLINPVRLPDKEYMRCWQEKPYIPKGFKEGTAYYETQNGERVRSKSEQIIADRLRAANIPYKYECPLKLNFGIVHPDFTILRMSDRKEIYYEHLGMMDDPDYANDNIQKITYYQLSGYTQGDRLFTTMETRQHPLDVRVLDRLIEEQFR